VTRSEKIDPTGRDRVLIPEGAVFIDLTASDVEASG
jgi:hypothetical protein